MEKSNIIGLLPNDLISFLEAKGEPSYRSKQIAQWLYQKKVTTWDEMKNLPLGLRQELSQGYDIGQIKVETERISTDQSKKYLLRLIDGNGIEIVVIPHRKRLTICLSTQVGCPVGCSFCATGQSGFSRNLTYQEIVESAWKAQIEKKSDIKNIVFMGMGEPLLNYENLKKTVEILSDENGRAMGRRRMTCSTAGIIPMIYKLTDEIPSINLAISLHSAIQEKRNQLMPGLKNMPLSELKKALIYYTNKTGNTITIEYLLINGINDSETDAKKLIDFLNGIKFVKVNLIHYNKVPFAKFEESKKELTFERILLQAGTRATIRLSKGTDVSAACGQLATTNQ